MTTINRIKDGFKHQKLITLPDHTLTTLNQNPITRSLYPVHMGYFPNAENHYVNRPEGAIHHILIMNIRGKGLLTLPGQKVVLEQNQMTIIPKNTPHHYEADKLHPWSIYWVHFTGDISKEVIKLLDCSQEPLTIDKPNRSIMVQYFNEMIGLLEMGYAPDHLYHVSSLFRLLITRVNHTSFIHTEAVTHQKDYTLEAMHYMQGHIHELLTLGDMAHVIGISRNHLMVVFKEKTGTSPVDYFIHMKMQKACELLGTTTYSIKKIASILGYSDPYYFSRRFKSVMNVSPKIYREKNIT